MLTAYLIKDPWNETYLSLWIDDAIEGDKKSGKAIVMAKGDDDYVCLDYDGAKKLERALHDLAKEMRIL